VNTESWKSKIEICMWNVWNLKIWEVKCLNWDVWIIQSSKLKFKIYMWSVKNLKIEMFEYWKLKSHCHSKQQSSNWYLNALLFPSPTKIIKMLNKLFYYTLQCPYWLLIKFLFFSWSFNMSIVHSHFKSSTMGQRGK